MGMEDFGVLLRPTQPLLASSIECDLLSQGFAANGRSPFPHTSTYVLSDASKNIEALLKHDPDNDALVSYLSIRYAVCQPETATEAFLSIVTQTMRNFCLQITGLAPGIEFSCDTLDAFQKCTVERVKRAKSRWSSLFAGDTEEVVLSVAGSWKYFAAKHPEVLKSGPLSVK